MIDAEKHLLWNYYQRLLKATNSIRPKRNCIIDLIHVIKSICAGCPIFQLLHYIYEKFARLAAGCAELKKKKPSEKCFWINSKRGESERSVCLIYFLKKLSSFGNSTFFCLPVCSSHDFFKEFMLFWIFLQAVGSLRWKSRKFVSL